MELILLFNPLFDYTFYITINIFKYMPIHFLVYYPIIILHQTDVQNL